jgi:NADPH:quinone reductase-like Zn-dependent oxidoreductase
MKAVLCRAFGPRESLTLEDVPDPRPVDGQVLIDVYAANLNFPDVLQIAGKYQFQPSPSVYSWCGGAGVVRFSRSDPPWRMAAGHRHGTHRRSALRALSSVPGFAWDRTSSKLRFVPLSQSAASDPGF